VHGRGRLRRVQGRGPALQHRAHDADGRDCARLSVQQAEGPEPEGLLLHRGQLADPGRSDRGHDEAEGREDPADDRVPDSAAEHGNAQHLRRGLPAVGIGDVARAVELAQADVSVTEIVLSLRGVSKAFGAVQALREVDFDCRAGEIHALVGENGSGKSTLLGIASGFVRPDAGEIEIGGRRLRRASPAHARRLGLGIAYQTYSHVLDLSVAQNLCLAVAPDAQPPYRSMPAWAEARLADFGLDLPVQARAGSLSLAERQLLEVVKALLARPKVLLLDEPTTALGPADVERLHALVFEQSRAGVAIAYVSHRLPEVLGIADRITVLRDGVGQGTFQASAMSEESLVALMIGRPLQLAFPERPAPA